MTSPLAEDPDPLASEISALKLTAATLLLRSPRLSLSQILELLDIGDAEFRDMTRDNAQIQTLRCVAKPVKAQLIHIIPPG